MNYSKITLLISQHRLKQKEFADIISATPHGVKYKFEFETFTVKDIEKIAEYFKVPISYFWEDYLIASEPKVKYETCLECRDKDAIIKLLTSQNKDKENQIALLNQELGRNQPGEREEAGRNAGNLQQII